MRREPKPFYKSRRNRRVCTIHCKRVTLGKTKDEAYAKFHEQMLDQDQVVAEISTVYQLSQVYLD